MLDFNREKTTQLNSSDFSRKGFIDERIAHLVAEINASEEFFTTSSCSGRILLIATPDDGSILKKGCQWLHVSHDYVNFEDVKNSLNQHAGTAVMKYESFILHIRCDTLEHAQKLHAVSLESGFKNSGLTVSQKGRITMAVRSSHSLEVPLSQNGKLLVDDNYLQFLVAQMNSKLKENFNRIQRFEENFKNMKIKKETSQTEKITKKLFSPDRVKSSKKTNPKDEVLKEDNMLPLLFEDT